MSERRGQSLVEFALILPLLIVVIMGVLDFGRAIAAYNSISNAARTGMRVAIVDQTEANVDAAARREAVGIAPITVEFEYVEDPDGRCPEINCLGRVTVHHQFTPIVPFFGPLDLTSQSEMTIECVSSASRSACPPQPPGP